MNDIGKLEKMLQMLISLAGNRSYALSELSEKYSRTERTIMRYIAAFRKAGFVVDCQDGRYRISKMEKPFKSLNDLLHFSEEEACILAKAIHSIDDTNLLKTNLIKKLYSLYDNDRIVDTVVKPELSTIVHQIIEAIRDKKQVLLRQYRSSHGNLVRDRLIEPFDFTTNYQFIWGFDPETRVCKLFKTSRIGSVTLLEKPFQFEKLHLKQPMDAFRISSQEQILVKLKLSLRAFNLLIEEYPLAEKYVCIEDDNYRHFEAPVCGFEGVGRFCMGLPGEVEIIEPESFKSFIKEKIKNFTYY